MENFYLSDLKEYIGSMQQAVTFTPFFEKYEVVISEDKEYLIGYENIKKERPAQYESPALLLAFVGLVQPPLPHSFKSINKDPMKKAIPIKNIIKFCKSFGMPYVEKESAEYIPAIEGLLRENGFIPQGVMELDHFRYRIAWLYTYFHIWYALYSGEDKEKKLLRYAQNWKFDSFVKDGKEATTIAKKFLAIEISSRMGKTRLVTEYDKEKNSFILAVHAQSLIDVAYFHLGNLLTMDKLDVRQHLKDCKNPRCNRLFWAKHGRQRYCEFCDRRIVHKLKPPKEAPTNGQ